VSRGGFSAAASAGAHSLGTLVLVKVEWICAHFLAK
jgi:hypothetical protein